MVSAIFLPDKYITRKIRLHLQNDLDTQNIYHAVLKVFKHNVMGIS